MFGYRRNNFIEEAHFNDENTEKNIDEAENVEEAKNTATEDTVVEDIESTGSNADKTENVEEAENTATEDTVVEGIESTENNADKTENVEETESDDVEEHGVVSIETKENEEVHSSVVNEDEEINNLVKSVEHKNASNPRKKVSKIWNAFAFLIFVLCAGVMFYYANKSSELASENYEMYIFVIKMMFIGISASWLCSFIGALSCFVDRFSTGGEIVKGIIHGIFVLVAMFPMANLWLGAFVNIDYLISYLSNGMQTSMLLATFLLVILQAVIQLATLFSRKRS